MTYKAYGGTWGCPFTNNMLPFEDYSVFLISGQSQSGKTSWIQKLCRHSKEMFNTPVDTILFYNKQFEPGFASLQQDVGNITFSPNLPNEEQLADSLQHSKHGLVIIDDALQDISSNPICQELATRLAHHLKTSVVFSTQSSQLPGKNGPFIARNIHNAIIMTSANQSYYLRNLGVQLGQYKELKEIYNSISQGGPYSYLCICCHPLRPSQYRFCTSVFPGEATTIYKARDQT